MKKKVDAGSEALLRLTVEVHRFLELAEVVAALAEHGSALAGATRSLAFRLDDDPKNLVLVADDTRGGERWDALKIGTADVERLLEEGARAEVDGVPEVLKVVGRWSEKPPGKSWLLGVRGATDDLAGLVVLPGDTLTPAAREGVVALIESCRPAVANAMQVRAIRELIIKDDTVECFNRRYFDDFLVEELARASRFRSAVSLIFFDMDNLKEVNSRHGHAIGSQTLMEVARRVRVKIRKFDKLFRFGGDEFCIVLPETEWHGALEVAERVRESIAGRPLLAAKVGGTGLHMTASFGIASFPLHARTGEELIMRADRSMQRIKTGSKNSIGIAEIAKADPS